MNRIEKKVIKNEVKSDERAEDFRFGNMSKTFGELRQDAKRPRRMPQPALLLASDSPKKPSIFSIFATSLPPELTPD